MPRDRLKQKENQKRWREKTRHSPTHIAAAKTRARKYMVKCREIIRNAKAAPCMDCKMQYPYYVMDFDHRPGTVKKFNIGANINNSAVSIMREIEKCDVVCSNCHRIRTYNRKIEHVH